MRATNPEIQRVIFHTIKELLPPPKPHPLGCHRPRISDELCFRGILIRLITGSSWHDIEAFLNYEVSDTTLRTRRDEWIQAGVFDQLCTQAHAAYDKIIGLDITDIVIDGSNHKAPCGGEGTGINPYDRGKRGWKWSLAVDRKGIPLVWTLDGANRNDYAMLTPTLDELNTPNMLEAVHTLHLDRGYGYASVRDKLAAFNIPVINVIPRNQPKQGRRQLVGLGQRWIVEAANGWLARYGQLRRNTDRKTRHRHAALCLATTILITGRLIDHRDKHQP